MRERPVEEAGLRVVEGDEVLFVDADDAMTVVEAIKRLLADRAHRDQMGHKARGTVLANFRWDVLAPQMIVVYEKVLTEGRWPSVCAS
jgi:glycosyltransferase involved in cell wall biosynthesis